MRTIEEIQADLKKAADYSKLTNSQACREIPADEYYSHYCGGVDKFSDELRLTLTDGIPLDRLREICAAERDRRCVVLQKPLTVDDIEAIKNIGRVVRNLDDMADMLTSEAAELALKNEVTKNE